MGIEQIEIEHRLDFVPDCETSPQGAGKQIGPAEVKLHRRVPEIVQPHASGIRGRSAIQEVELTEEDGEVFREILRVLHARERRHVLVQPRKRHGKVRRCDRTVDLVAVLPQARLAAEIEVPSVPESHFPGVDVDQIIAAAAISELLREAAGGDSLIVLGEVAEKRQAIFGECVACATPVAG